MNEIEAHQLAGALQERARAGAGPVELARALVVLAGDSFKPTVYQYVFHLAFGVSLEALRDTGDWVGFGYRGIGDEGFVATLSPFVDAWRQGQSS